MIDGAARSEHTARKHDTRAKPRPKHCAKRVEGLRKGKTEVRMFRLAEHRRQRIGSDLQQRVQQALASVRLAGYAERYPRQLSGGQQQRVAVARSIAPRPSILLFDEPLSNLDAALRDEMQIELKRLQREVGITTLFVTHDQAEALSMSDRVCVLADGHVQQFGTPEEIYHRPATGFVARFIGRPNRLSGRLAQASNDGGAEVELAGGLRLPVAAAAGLGAGSAVDIVLRQEDIRLAREGAAGHGGQVVLRSFIGSRVQYVVALGAGVEVIVETPTNGPDAGLEPGAAVRVAVDPQHVYVSAAAA